MKKPGLLFALVGPAGVGKNQLMKYVMARSPVTQLPTATTRAIREGEKEGREHFFVTDAAFSNMIEGDEMLEWQHVHHRRYGMVRQVVEDALAKGQPIIADIDIYGAITIRERYPENTVSIFIQPPSIGTLIERMRNRGDREAEISKRLLRVSLELSLATKCDYVIVNDNFDHTAQTLLGTVLAELENRATRPGSAEVQLAVPYQYLVRVIPFQGNRALRHGDRFITTPFDSGEQPAERALRVLQSTLGITPHPEQLIHGDLNDEAFIPPLSLDYARAPHGETITFNYLYRLDDSFVAPDDWQWLPTQAISQFELVKGQPQ